MYGNHYSAYSSNFLYSTVAEDSLFTCAVCVLLVSGSCPFVGQFVVETIENIKVTATVRTALSAPNWRKNLWGIWFYAINLLMKSRWLQNCLHCCLHLHLSIQLCPCLQFQLVVKLLLSLKCYIVTKRSIEANIAAGQEV